MPYTLTYHPRVADDDLDKITPTIRRRIERSIESRLRTAPERYGSPLSGTLHGFRKLRVGDYRVIYSIQPSEVRVIAIVHRREAYARAERRLR